MNQPFLDELAVETLQDPALVAPRLLDLINQLSPAQSGGFLDLQGQPLPW